MAEPEPPLDRVGRRWLTTGQLLIATGAIVTTTGWPPVPVGRLLIEFGLLAAGIALGVALAMTVKP